MRRGFFTACTACAIGALALPALAADDDFELGALPPPAAAPPPYFADHIELGAGYQNINSYYFARYGGNPSQGPFAVADIGLAGGDAWDSGGVKSWAVEGLADSFDRLSLTMHYGAQGHWLASAFYDDFTHYDADHAVTPFNGAGTTMLTLPTNWVAGASSLQFANLRTDLKPLDLKVRWQTVGGDFVLKPWSGYELRLHVDERNRYGQQAQSLPFGQEANYPVGIFFPMPVDYDSTHLTASFGFNNTRVQWNASYSLAVFNDANTSVSVPNPYSRSLGTVWEAGAFAGYPYAVAQYSTPPDSMAHQFTLAGAYAMTPVTRITARLSYAIQTQNAPFLPYTPNPNINAPIPLPRSSLDGRVDKTFANIGITSRPWTNVDFSASYSFDNRADHTPMSLYSYVANDAQDQPSVLLGGVSHYIRYNLPYSYTFQTARAEVGYRLTPDWRLSLSYTGEFQHRTDQEVSETDEHTVRAKVLRSFSIGSVWVAGTYAARDGSAYDSALPWNLSHTTAYLNFSPNDQSIEYPLLRKYYLADLHHEEAKGGLTINATDNLAIDLSGGYGEDDYIHSSFGLNRFDSLLADADVSYTIKTLTASVFYTYEQIGADQTGYYIATQSLTNPAQIWTAQNQDTVHTAGARADWQAIPNTLKLTASYTLSYGTTNIGVAAMPFTALAITAPLPDNHAITHAIATTADYRVRPNMTLRLGYRLERHITDDWAYLGSLTPAPQILGSGDIAPRYTAQVVRLSARYEF